MNPYLFSQMRWSYSRLSCFGDCPYKFFLRYIELEDEKQRFFASYGSFLHAIIADFLTGYISAEDAVTRYLTQFHKEVCGTPPSQNIYVNYFNQGLRFVERLEPLKEEAGVEVLGVEQYVEFEIDGFPFIGFIDLLARDADGLVIIDHKAKDLKPRSKRKKPSQADAELDRYLRQLYLYSIPLHDRYGEYPQKLVFNCYRTGETISEPFREEGLEEARAWALASIEAIRVEEDWRPKLEYFPCRYICGLSEQCDYYQMWR